MFFFKNPYLLVVTITLILITLIFRYKKIKKNIIYFKLITDYIYFRFKYILLSSFNIGISTSFKDKIELYFYHGTEKYKIIFPKKRIRTITDVVLRNNKDYEQNITKEFLKLLGPGFNFYGIQTTPKLLGYNDSSVLIIKYRNDKEIVYNSGDIILI